MGIKRCGRRFRVALGDRTLVVVCGRQQTLVAASGAARGDRWLKVLPPAEFAREGEELAGNGARE